MEATELKDYPAESILKIVEDNTVDFRWDRDTAFYIAKNKYLEAGKKSKADEMEKEAFLFSNYDIEHAPTRDVPKLDYKSIYDDKKINYYKRRAKETTNPIMKAKYCDTIWETKKEMDFLKTAVDSYLESCEIYFKNDWGIELSNALNRALKLSAMIKDDSLIQKSFGKHIEFLKRLSDEKRYRWTLEIIESLLNYNKLLSDKLDYNYLIRVLEEGINYACENDSEPFHMIQEHLKIIESILRVNKDEEEIERVKIRMAEQFEKEGDWKKGSKYNSNLVAAHFYELALKKYIEIGGQDEKIKDLKVKIEEANRIGIKTEMKAIQTSIELPKEHFEKVLEVYKNKNIDEILKFLAQDPRIIPSFETSKANAERIYKNSIMYNIVPLTLLDENVKHKTLSEESDKLEYHTIRTFMMSYKTLTSSHLNGIFDILLTDKDAFFEGILKYFDDSYIIKDERKSFLRESLLEFIEERYIGSMHTLIFQIEGILRDMLGLLGLPMTSYRNSSLTQRMLNDVLETLSEVPGIDNNLIKFVEILLSNLHGDNFRNDTAHGLGKVENYNKSNCQILIYILIKLASYKISNEKV